MISEFGISKTDAFFGQEIAGGLSGIERKTVETSSKLDRNGSSHFYSSCFHMITSFDTVVLSRSPLK
jgi:hypothetical protein